MCIKGARSCVKNRQTPVEQLLAKHKIERRVVLSTPHFMSIPFIIASTDLLVTVPYAVGESFARIASIRLIEPPLEIPKEPWEG